MLDEVAEPVGDEEHDPPFAGELVHLAEELVRLLVGQRRVGLVEQEDARVAGDGAGDLGPLLGGERAVREERPASRAMPSACITPASAMPSRGRPVRVPSRPTSTFSATVRFGKSCGSWWTTATWCQSTLGNHGRPSTVSVPESGRSSPAMMRTSVLLPAPFGPAMPSTSPGRMSRSMPSSATVLP